MVASLDGSRALSRLFLRNWLLLLVFIENVAEDVVEDEVAGLLRGEDEGLGELAVRGGLVRNLAKDLKQDVVAGVLSVDVGDANLGVLVLELLDAFTDGLAKSALYQYKRGDVTYLRALAHRNLLLLQAGNELRLLGVE